MTLTVRIFILFFSVVVLVFAWLMRIDAKPSGVGAVVVTDRWIGRVYYCFGGCVILYPKPEN
jgi:hypothetical protein